MIAPDDAPVAGAARGRWLEAVLRPGASVAGHRAALAARWERFAPERLDEIAVLGAAGEGERLVRTCVERRIRVRLLADGNPARIGGEVAGLKVAPFEALLDLPRSCPVVIASHRLLGATRRLREVGFSHVGSCAVLQVLTPEFFSPHMFYAGWLEDLVESRSAYARLADLLADDQSRATLDALLGFRLTLDPELLAPVLDDALYVLPGRSFGRDEVYIDGGAYDGDSVRMFLGRVNSELSRVLAFEPDPATFQRLRANFAGDSRVTPVNRGLYDGDGELSFNADGTRGALLVEAEGVTVPVTSVDSTLNGARATFIKMNIEGAELAALRGARATIARYSPSLAISAYHLPSHLHEVPFVIRELNPDYRLYLRQHDGGVIETVCYAVAP